MAAAKSNSFCFFFFFFSLLVLSCSHVSTYKAPMVPAIYTFGDSLLDVGNNNYIPNSRARANSPPHGVDFPTKKPTGRFCNGKNAADLLAEKVGLPTPPPYLGLLKQRKPSFLAGVSFASGDAGILKETNRTPALPLIQQVDSYILVFWNLEKAMGSQSLKKHLAESLFDVVIGTNDFLVYLNQSRPSLTPQQYVHLLLTSLDQQLKRLYTHGARKFTLTGMDMLGCHPSLRWKTAAGCLTRANKLALEYNAGLTGLLRRLKEELKGFSYSYFDSFSVMNDILRNPSKYGFTEVKDPCRHKRQYCPNRRDHVFWDEFHATEATYRIMVDYCFEGSSRYTKPMNVRQLIAVCS